MRSPGAEIMVPECKESHESARKAPQPLFRDKGEGADGGGEGGKGLGNRQISMRSGEELGKIQVH